MLCSLAVGSREGHLPSLVLSLFFCKMEQIVITLRDDVRQGRGAGPGTGKASRSPQTLLANVLVSLLWVHLLSRPTGPVPDLPWRQQGAGATVAGSSGRSLRRSQLFQPACALPHYSHFPNPHDLGSLPAGVGLPARVFSLPKGADLWFPLRVTSGREGLAPREGGEMTQLFPQPCGAGSTVHSSMGAPGKGPARRPRCRGRLSGLVLLGASLAWPALPPQLSPLSFHSVPQQLPLPIPGPHSQLLFLLSFHIRHLGAPNLFPSSLLPCSEGSRGGMPPGWVAGCHMEDRRGSDLSRGSKWVGGLSELLDVPWASPRVLRERPWPG